MRNAKYILADYDTFGTFFVSNFFNLNESLTRAKQQVCIPM